VLNGNLAIGNTYVITAAGGDAWQTVPATGAAGVLGDVFVATAAGINVGSNSDGKAMTLSLGDGGTCTPLCNKPGSAGRGIDAVPRRP
jgi:hypothetical protein